jgi:hypothetical protein
MVGITRSKVIAFNHGFHMFYHMFSPYSAIKIYETKSTNKIQLTLALQGQDLFRSYTSKNILTHSTGLDRNLERKVRGREEGVL